MGADVAREAAPDCARPFGVDEASFAQRLGLQALLLTAKALNGPPPSMTVHLDLAPEQGVDGCEISFFPQFFRKIGGLLTLRTERLDPGGLQELELVLMGLG